MADKFQNKYRISSARLRNWDYGSDAMYFITICTKNRDCYFGNITNGIMALSELGMIVDAEWLKTFEMRPDMNLQMGNYVVMPNHFHAIISIGDNKYNSKWNDDAVDDAVDGMVGDAVVRDVVDDAVDDAVVRDAMHRVSTGENEYKNKFGSQSKNLASIIRGFKSAVTLNAHMIHADFNWQSRFHDHIIRNDESFHRISNYIISNPSKWADDKFFIE